MRPMLATLTEALPQGPDWVHEVKWDGMRVLADEAAAEREAALQAASAPIVPLIDMITIGVHGEFGDRVGRWSHVRGVSSTGAILVRPDGVVAWRAHDAAGAELLASALEQVAVVGADAAAAARAVPKGAKAVSA